MLALIDRQAVLTAAQISLAYFLSESYLAPLAVFIGLMLPPGLGQQADTLYTIQRNQTASHLNETQRRLLALLEKHGGSLSGRQIDHALPRLDWRPATRSLALTRAAHLSSSPTHSPRRVQAGSAHRQAGVFSGGSPPRLPKACQGRNAQRCRGGRRCSTACCKNRDQVDVAWLYAESGASLADLQHLAGMGLVALGESQVWQQRSIAGRHAGVQRTAPPDPRPAGLLAGDPKERGRRQSRSAG